MYFLGMSYPLTSSIYLTDLDQIHFVHWARSNIGFDLYWNKTNVVGWEDQKKEKKFLEGKFLARSDRHMVSRCNALFGYSLSKYLIVGGNSIDRHQLSDMLHPLLVSTIKLIRNLAWLLRYVCLFFVALILVDWKVLVFNVQTTTLSL